MSSFFEQLMYKMYPGCWCHKQFLLYHFNWLMLITWLESWNIQSQRFVVTLLRNFVQRLAPRISSSHSTKSEWLPTGGKWPSRAREFESQHWIPVGSVFRFICCKTVLTEISGRQKWMKKRPSMVFSDFLLFILIFSIFYDKKMILLST